MQTFEQDFILKSIPTGKLYIDLINYAKSKGVPVYIETCIDSYENYPDIIFNKKELSGCEIGYNGKDITFEQFFRYCDNWSKCQPVTVKLNDDYTAKIEGNTVKVGCQIFEFEAIERLYNAIKKTP